MPRLRAIVVALILGTVMSPQHTQAASDLAALTIQLSDLRPGYVLADAHYRNATSIASAAQLTVRQLLDHGWVAGYQALYHRRLDVAIEVGDFVDRFRSAAGAQWWYGINLKYIPASYRQIQLAGVGNQSVALEGGASNPRTGFVAMIFRQGPYVAEVYVSLQATAPLAAVVALARLMDLRMQREAPAASTPRLGVARPNLFIRAWVSPNPVPNGSYPTLFARTVTGAGCSAAVTYVSAQPATSFNGYVQIAGTNGMVSWSWHAKTGGSGGTARVSCTFQGREVTAQAPFRINH
jgi:hypothetical protein